MNVPCPCVGRSYNNGTEYKQACRYLAEACSDLVFRSFTHLAPSIIRNPAQGWNCKSWWSLGHKRCKAKRRRCGAVLQFGKARRKLRRDCLSCSPLDARARMRSVLKTWSVVLSSVVWLAARQKRRHADLHQVQAPPDTGSIAKPLTV
jgi:hypothetical protein